jgi:Phage integrase, N-terminal SAM-like domain
VIQVDPAPQVCPARQKHVLRTPAFESLLLNRGLEYRILATLRIYSQEQTSGCLCPWRAAIVWRRCVSGRCVCETDVRSLHKRKLLDQVRDAIRARHYSRRTEECYVGWIRRFIVFHGKRHPLEMGEAEMTTFLSALAIKARVSASTQNQALSALLFLPRSSEKGTVLAR